MTEASPRPPTHLVRAPSPEMFRAELTHLPRRPVDPERAAAQHAGYVRVLEELGARVRALPPLPGAPDCAFVEDVALAFPEVFVETRPGARSRRREGSSVFAALPDDRPRRALTAPATLDGGDVLTFGRRIHVGISSRTNRAGFEQLREILTPFGYETRAVAVGGALHLKTAATFLPDGRLLANPDWIDPSSLAGTASVACVAPGERFGANSDAFGEAVLLPADAVGTAERLERLGFRVVRVDIAEFAAVEAGLTCLRLRL